MAAETSSLVQLLASIGAALSGLAGVLAALGALKHSRGVRRDLEDPEYPGKTPTDA